MKCQKVARAFVNLNGMATSQDTQKNIYQENKKSQQNLIDKDRNNRDFIF